MHNDYFYHPDYFHQYYYIIYRVFRKKLCFFHNSLQPLLAYIAAGDPQSSQRNAIVQSFLLAGNLLYNQ